PPGPDGGGRYSLLVRTVGFSGAGGQRYHLQVAAAGADDAGPGVPIRSGTPVHGALYGGGVDVVDVYRFDVTALSDVDLTLRTAREFALRLLDEGGRTMYTTSVGGAAQRVRLRRGEY